MWPLPCLDESCEMTLPRLARPALIEIPSFARSPVAPVFFSLSLPARSTKCSLLSVVTTFSELMELSDGTDTCLSLLGVIGVIGPESDFFCTRFKLKTA